MASYVYLAFVAFIVSYTAIAAAREDVIGFIVWPFAFVAALWPIHKLLMMARIDAGELGYAGPQVEALHVSYLTAFVGFFLFVFLPKAMNFLWGWVPFVSG